MKLLNFLAALVLLNPVFGWCASTSDDDVKKCRTLDGDNLDLAIHHCTLAVKSGQLPDAILAEMFYKRADWWLVKREHDRAISDLDAVIKLNPQNPNAYNDRGENWRLKRNYDRALPDFDTAIRMYPQHAMAYLGRGRTWLAKREFDRAIVDLDAAIGILAPASKGPVIDSVHLRLARNIAKDYVERLADTYYFRGAAWYGKNDDDRAIADFDLAIRYNATDAGYFLARGWAWFNKKDYDHAIADFASAIRLSPANGSYYVARGWTWSNKQEYDRAIADYDAAIRLNAQDVFAYGNRAIAWQRKGIYERAIADYEQTIRLDPRNPISYNKLAWLLATARTTEYRNGRRAVDLAQKACELAKWKNPEYLDTLAAAHAEAGNFAESIRSEERALAFPLPQDARREEFKKRLELFRDGKPYRD